MNFLASVHIVIEIIIVGSVFGNEPYYFMVIDSIHHDVDVLHVVFVNDVVKCLRKDLTRELA